MGAALLGNSSLAWAGEGPEEESGRLTPGDAALLRFAVAAEALETDVWDQYNELGGVQDNEFPGGGGTGNPSCTAALPVLDMDIPQCIHDNTDDEFTLQNFLNAYLVSKGADPLNLEQFRTLPDSSATGFSGKLRLINLAQLTPYTSWQTRYREDSHYPGRDPNFNRSQHRRWDSIRRFPEPTICSEI